MKIIELIGTTGKSRLGLCFKGGVASLSISLNIFVQYIDKYCNLCYSRAINRFSPGNLENLKQFLSDFY